MYSNSIIGCVDSHLAWVMTVREWLGISEWGFGQSAIRRIVEMTFGRMFTDIHSSPKEKQLWKSCVSFGEECSTFFMKKLEIPIQW